MIIFSKTTQIQRERKSPCSVLVKPWSLQIEILQGPCLGFFS